MQTKVAKGIKGTKPKTGACSATTQAQRHQQAIHRVTIHKVTHHSLRAARAQAMVNKAATTRPLHHTHSKECSMGSKAALHTQQAMAPSTHTTPSQPQATLPATLQTQQPLMEPLPMVILKEHRVLTTGV
jgi:hypothetical protein